MRQIQNFIIVIAVSAFSIFQIGILDAHAACILSQAQWGVTSAKTGEPIQMRVLGSGCQGKTATISVFASGKLIQSNLKASFDATGQFAGSSVTIYKEDITGLNPDGSATIRFVADVEGSTVESDGIKITTSPTTTTVQPGPIGKEVNLNFEILNPLKINSFLEFFTTIAVWITNIAIPIAVILIVYAGILFLTAGAYPANVSRARTVLTYVIIGLAVILIGRGFISLIESVLNLGGASPTPAPTASIPTI